MIDPAERENAFDVLWHWALDDRASFIAKWNLAAGSVIWDSCKIKILHQFTNPSWTRVRMADSPCHISRLFRDVPINHVIYLYGNCPSSFSSDLVWHKNRLRMNLEFERSECLPYKISSRKILFSQYHIRNEASHRYDFRHSFLFDIDDVSCEGVGGYNLPRGAASVLITGFGRAILPSVACWSLWVHSFGSKACYNDIQIVYVRLSLSHHH